MKDFVKRLILWVLVVLLAVSTPIVQAAADEAETEEVPLQEESSEENIFEEAPEQEEVSAPSEDEIPEEEPALEEEDSAPEEEETSKEEPAPEEQPSEETEEEPSEEEAPEEVPSTEDEVPEEELSPEDIVPEEELSEEEPVPEEESVPAEEEAPEEEAAPVEEEVPVEEAETEEEAVSESNELPEVIDHMDGPDSIRFELVSGQSYSFSFKAGEKSYFKFVPKETAYYTLESTGTKDTYGILYDADMAMLEYMDDIDYSAGNMNFRLRVELEAGQTYYYLISFNSSTESGYLPFWLRKTNPGWNLNNDVWYYYDQNGLPALGIRTIGSYKYAFNSEGRMQYDTTFQENYDVYFFDSKGHMVEKEGWAKTSKGRYVYINAYGTCYYGWLQYNNKYYYLDPWMNYGETDWIDNKLYYFRKDGTLVQTPGWFQDDWGYWYYVKNKNGELAYYLQTIGGKQYYFSEDGIMYQSCVFLDEETGNTYYVADASGHISEVSIGWNKAGAYYWYFEGGQPVTDEIRQINGSYYGFADTGFMFDGCEFTLNGKSYRAAVGGKLYRNQWFSYRGKKQYYGNDCALVCDCVTTIGGKKYAFDGDGWLEALTFFEDSGTTYYAGSDGVLTALKIGWNRLEGKYYYLDSSNGIIKNTVWEVDGKLYGFAENGVMYDDQTFWMSYYYMAKKGGALYKNQWVQSGGMWYYFDEQGKGVNGLNTIDGTTYYFSAARMLTSTYMPNSGKLYYCNEKGVASVVTKDGLYRNEGTYNFYYVSNENLLTNAWKKADGKWYYFDSHGDGSTSIRSTIDGKSYYFDSNGALRTDGWIYANSGSIFYATSSGVLLTGEQKIGGKWYYFDSTGYLMTGVVSYNGKLYLCGSDGAYIGTLKNGWNQIQGIWYYVEDGTLIKTKQHYKIGSDYYTFDSDGKMQTNHVDYQRYIYGSNGKLVKNGWCKINGAYYYVENEKYVEDCFKTINGTTYYFDEDGVMCTGETLFVDGDPYIVKCNTSGAVQSLTLLKDGWNLIDGLYYYIKSMELYTGWVGSYFIDQGIMVTNEVVDGYWLGNDGKYVKSSWVTPKIDRLPNDLFIKRHYENARMYAKETGLLAHNEWVTIGGESYYFDESGLLVRKAMFLNGKVYQLDDSGKYVKTITSLPKSGWLKVGSEYMYFQNSTPVIHSTMLINGAYYVFDDFGIMIKDSKLDGFYLGTDGKLLTTTGWKKIDGNWYYFDQAYRFANREIMTINGKKYYFNSDGIMQTGGVAISDDDGYLLYEFDENGVFQSINTTQNGWVKVGDEWFYLSSGYLVRKTCILIDGKLYGFDDNGAMLKNQVMSDDDSNRIYFFGSNGVVSASEGWKKASSGSWYYTDANGRCYTGIHTINGKTYYFSRRGQLLS